MIEHSTTMLAELMAKRRGCLTQLRDLGARQSTLIAAGETSELLRLAAAKGQLIAALQALEKRLAPYHEQDPQRRAWSSEAARAACAADADACRRLVAEVMEMEQAGERQMTTQRDEVANQLRCVVAGGRVHQAYQANR